MSNVRAKFKCVRIERSMQYDKEVRTIVLTPVYKTNNPDDENTKFFNATPSGEIKLGCVNHEAALAFELDKEYYVDFTLAKE